MNNTEDNINKKGKVVFVHHSGDIGGAGVSLYNTICALEHDYEIIVYCPEKPSRFREFLESKNIITRTYDYSLGSIYNFSGGPSILNPSFVQKLFNIFKSVKKLDAFIEQEKPDLLIVNSKTLAWVSMITRKKSIKSICYVRETKKNNPLNVFNYITKFLLNKFDKVIFISKYDKVTENLKCGKSEVVPNFVKTINYRSDCSASEILEKYNVPKDRFNILFVGGMARLKGIHLAVKAIAYLKDFDVNLIIVGNPNFEFISSDKIYYKIYNSIKSRYMNSIEKCILKNNLENKIFKLGIQKEMADMYTICDVLIFPAIKPHQARPVFEAGVQKKPVIMPDFNNTKEYVKNNYNGLVFKKRDAKSLAEAIKKLIKNPELVQKLGEKNHELTLKNHLRENSEITLRKVINEVISTDSVKPRKGDV